MKMTRLNPAAARQKRRELWHRDRLSAQTLSVSFPQVEQIRFELSFQDPGPHVPSPQAYSLNPPAQAFFRFPCPRADCDGQFNLEAAVTDLVSGNAREATGQFHCHGVRVRDQATGQQCQLQLNYHLIVKYKRDKAA